MQTVDVIVAHSERATVRVGDVYVKIDADPRRTDVELRAMTLAPVPTARILWQHTQALALAALPGVALGRLGESSDASVAAWVATGAMIRTLHDAPLPPWPGKPLEDLVARLDAECEWLIAHAVLPPAMVSRHHDLAMTAMRPRTPVFVHGDLQVDHVFVDGDHVTGILDWSEAAPGDGLFDLATLTVGHPEHLDDVLLGYGTEVDRDLIRAWWAWRCLVGIRWLSEHGYGAIDTFPEVAVLHSLD